MKPSSNNLTGFKKTDVSNTENHQDLHNSYHSPYKGIKINSTNGHIIDQPCVSSSWTNGQSSNTSSDKLAKYTNIDELTDFKKLCIFNLPESDGYESSTIQEKRELLLAREFGINKEVRKRDEQVIVITVAADTDIGRESYAADKKKKAKRKKVRKTSSIRRSSSKPSDESADMPDAKEQRQCTSPESIEEGCSNQKEDLQNGYSDSLVLKQEDDNMDKGNDSDSSSVTNQDMDEMIVVKKKRRLRIKNNVAAAPATATNSQSLPDNKSPRWDSKQKQKGNVGAKLKPLKISTASFDMDQDFPPLTAHPLSANSRREKVQSPSKSVDKPVVHPSKSDSDLPAPTNYELRKSFVEEKQTSVEDKMLMSSESISDDIVVVAANDDKQTEEKVDDQMKEENGKKMENVDQPVEKQDDKIKDVKQSETINSRKRDIDNNERETSITDQHLCQPGPSSMKKKEYRNDGHRSHSQNYFTSQTHGKHRPRNTNTNNGTRRSPRYSGFQNYSNNYGYMNQHMNPPYVSTTQAPSGYRTYYQPVSTQGYHNAFAQLPPLRHHPPTRFMPHQTFLPMQIPYPSSNAERFQGPSFYQQRPVHTNNGAPGMIRSTVSNTTVSVSSTVSENGEKENTVEVSPSTTPVADYNGHRPPSVPVTVSDIHPPLLSFNQNRQSVETFAQNNYSNHIHQPVLSAPPGMERSFVVPSTSMPSSVSQVSVVDSTMVRMVDNNISPLSRSPDSASSSTTHPATTTGSSNSDPSLINHPAPFPRAIDTLTLSPELQQTVREAFGLQPNEGIFYIYATNDKGEHTRQMRVILHNTTPVKFGKFASPVYLSPTVGPVGEYSPAGYYYAKQERFNVASPEGHPPLFHTVTQHQPILNFSVTIPEQYQVPLMPTYYPNVIVLPRTAPIRPPVEEAPPSTYPVFETELMSELSPSASEISSMPITTSSDTSAQ